MKTLKNYLDASFSVISKKRLLDIVPEKSFKSTKKALDYENSILKKIYKKKKIKKNSFTQKIFENKDLAICVSGRALSTISFIFYLI